MLSTMTATNSSAKQRKEKTYSYFCFYYTQEDGFEEQEEKRASLSLFRRSRSIEKSRNRASDSFGESRDLEPVEKMLSNEMKVKPISPLSEHSLGKGKKSWNDDDDDDLDLNYHRLGRNNDCNSTTEQILSNLAKLEVDEKEGPTRTATLTGSARRTRPRWTPPAT